MVMTAMMTIMTAIWFKYFSVVEEGRETATLSALIILRTVGKKVPKSNHLTSPYQFESYVILVDLVKKIRKYNQSLIR